MLWLAGTAAFVGFVHSLSPAHWIPIALVSKTRRWNLAESLWGALVAAFGHILTSSILALVVVSMGMHFLADHEESFEEGAGYLLILFGFLYAFLAYRRHSHCAAHAHHGPKIKSDRHPFWFLFFMGFAPCVAVLPVFISAAPFGSHAIVMTLFGFWAGVIAALCGATVLVSVGLRWLDHPVFEHYGDVITGVSVAILGVVLLVFDLH